MKLPFAFALGIGILLLGIALVPDETKRWAFFAGAWAVIIGLIGMLQR